MLLNKNITIKGHSRNIKHYKKLGYDIKVGQEIEIKTQDLMKGSTTKVLVMCSNCKSKKNVVFKDYINYTNNLEDHYYCNKCRHLKIKDTVLNKYGVDNVMKIDSVKEKFNNSINTKYGVSHYSKTHEYKNKYKSTCRKKYGVDNVSNLQKIKDKISKQKIENFNSIDKYQKIIPIEYSIKNYEYNNDRNLIFTINHNICGEDFTINRMNLYDRINNKNIVCTKCNKVEDFSSSGEKEIVNFLKNCGVNVIENNRSILKNKELDIYLPEYNIAIEFNGLYRHSEIYKGKDYHLNKTLECEEKGIELIHIFEDDWLYKQDIVKSILLNRLGKTQNIIYARKCVIKNVSASDSKDFLNENHIQGQSKSTYKIGLYYENELISLMTFGVRYSNIKKDFELLRFCNKKNFNVIGSANKLFKYFQEKYKYNEIISYSDRSIFSGGLYKILGFKKNNISKPSFYWVKDMNKYHRFVFNKKKLISMGYDKSKTEIQIMSELGYTRIWNCGHIKWVYKNI